MNLFRDLRFKLRRLRCLIWHNPDWLIRRLPTMGGGHYVECPVCFERYCVQRPRAEYDINTTVRGE